MKSYEKGKKEKGWKELINEEESIWDLNNNRHDFNGKLYR